MKLKEILQNLDFTESESKVYLALLELSEAKTGKICEKTGIASSNLHLILQSLIEKGMISYKVVNNIKVYRASNLETLKNILREKKKELDAMGVEVEKEIEEMNASEKEKRDYSDYRYFEGLNGIKSMWAEISETMKPNTEIDIYASKVESFEFLTPFYLDVFHNARKRKKVHQRIILPLGSKQEAAKRMKTGNIEIRYDSIENEAEFIVFDDFIAIQHTDTTGTKPQGFLIQDSKFAQSFRNIFDKLWSKAEKKLK